MPRIRFTPEQIVSKLGREPINLPGGRLAGVRCALIADEISYRNEMTRWAITGSGGPIYLFNHLIGAPDHWQGYFYPECLSRFEVYDHLDFCRLYHWQARRLLSIENFACI
jgi:hypothetical protein